ncbi:3'(2'),5'-bisphosphate nucleotidase [Gracilibacillus halophilus YIM-C55.5]|uniref:3'(2'),5'-bisphosphate nucleotidase CysQ n=1 Tax=Gracilibacillus halophilus YIM-C55.5 TaxID=1308866 RepID=N4WNZ6_9BACI|nr:3'(2'),5'-bisphosphate nucleotidase CysQ [Gracilibacillus halophilus]ENH96210.1 3'(2'),5'-bisphosphate nucleotidase [Gracilibacillus halophilus YIM-C55.5]
MEAMYQLYRICLEAGEEILKVYHEEIDVEYKSDDSPLTIADQRAHDTIVRGLQRFDSSIPVLSEEGKEKDYDTRKQWEQFWLVDPLDGTKEFIKKNGEFTVNIALIEGHYPVSGVIYAPALDTFYFGSKDQGAYKLEKASERSIQDVDDLIAQSTQLPFVDNPDVTHVVASRSHMSEETEDFIQSLEGPVDVVSSGSSLKFCLVAEGKADYYPRYAPTMEWDTGAGQAIVEAAGGQVTRYEDDERFDYNREDLLNGWFLAKR